MEDKDFHIQDFEDDSGRIDDNLMSEGHEEVPYNVACLIIWLINHYPHVLLDELMERGFPWPPDVPWDKPVWVSQDDTDARLSGFWIGMAKDGDIWADFDMQSFDDKKRMAMSHNLRFRTFNGGTKNPRMNAALRILIFACLKDGQVGPYIKDPDTGRPIGWGQMRDAEKLKNEEEGVE